MGLFQPGNLVWTLLYHLRIWSAASAFYTDGTEEKLDLAGKILITPFLVFLGIVAVTTVTELIGSYLMEWLTGDWMWDYRRFSFDFQGRIALNPSLRFGAGGMIILYLFQPFFERLIRPGFRAERSRAVSWGLAAILTADTAATLILRISSGV